jgi:trypsin
MKHSFLSFTTAVVLANISSIQGNDIDLTEKRIVGGTAAGKKEYPFFAFPNAGGMCGASVIHSDILMTAAHCGKELWTSGVWVGGNNLNLRNSKFYDVVTSVIHPNFSPITVQNDIQLIKINGFIPPPYAIPNFNASLPYDGQELTAIGYGATKEGGRISKSLQKVNFYTVSYDICNQTYEDELVDSLMVCNGGIPQGGKDTCQGDSGGPIFLANTTTQIGIVSFGYGCARAGIPAINSRVSAFEGFINEWICRLSDNRPASCPATNAPFTAPTVSPTMEPTPEPTPVPTRAPTRKPTRAPVKKPVMTMAPKTARPVRPVVIKPPVKAPTQAPAIASVSRTHLACKPTGSRCTAKTECCGENALCRGFPVRTCT